MEANEITYHDQRRRISGAHRTEDLACWKVSMKPL
jgi:hypothetical protein